MPTTALNSPSDQKRLRAVAAGIVLLGGLLGALLSLLVGEPARRALFDGWQDISPRSVGSDRVAVVLIDPNALESLGPWPWPRYYLARLTEKVGGQRPLAIGYDMIFPEADRLNPDNFASLYPELTEAERAKLSSLPTMDSVFAKTIGAAPVVLGRLGIDSNGSDPDQLLVDPEIAGVPPSGVLSYRQALTSIPEIDDVALGHGMLNGPPDDDGIVRSIPLTVKAGGRPMPGFAVELARIAAGVPALRWDGDSLLLGGKRIPADQWGRLHLRFGIFPASATYSATDLLGRGLDPSALTGKVVLIGIATEGSADLVSTPVQTEGYGAFVQAQAVDAILKGGWLYRPAWVVAAEWGAGALLVMVVVAASLYRRRWVMLALVVVIALPLISWLSFDRANTMFDPIRPAMMSIGAALALQSLLYVRARAERERLAAALVEQRVASAHQEGELRAARSIQLGMVPSPEKLAKIDPRLDVSGLLDPARSVGGDFYDVTALDSDRYLFVIGDVTGKGVPAALYMALSKGLAKSFLTRDGGKLADAVAMLNRELLRDADDAMGVTMLIAILDCSTGELSMVNAGHENPILRHLDGKTQSFAMRGGPPFCVCDFPYQAEGRQLQPGDTILFITDGVTEAQKADGALFGVSGAIESISSSDGNAEVTARTLVQAVRAFEGETEPSDDLTILAVRYLGKDRN